MHIGETMLALGALAIFSTVILTLNSVKIESGQRMMETEFEITAVGIAQSIIEEAQGLRFDEGSEDFSFLDNNYEVFSGAGNLGPESGEYYPFFDDVDDYNGFVQDISTPRSNYTVTVAVSYADTSSLDIELSNRTLMKIMDVKVTSVFFRDTVICSFVFSFH